MSDLWIYNPKILLSKWNDFWPFDKENDLDKLHAFVLFLLYTGIFLSIKYEDPRNFVYSFMFALFITYLVKDKCKCTSDTSDVPISNNTNTNTTIQSKEASFEHYVYGEINNNRKYNNVPTN